MFSTHSFADVISGCSAVSLQEYLSLDECFWLCLVEISLAFPVLVKQAQYSFTIGS